MKIAIAQFEVHRGFPDANIVKISKFAERAGAAGADLLCLPEMCTTGFDWKKNQELLEATDAHIESIVTICKSHRIAICGSFLRKTEQGKATNTFHYINKSGVDLANYRKIHLFSLFKEDAHVEAGNECVAFETDHGIFGASICYDLRFPELFRRTTEAGATLHILPAAFPHPRLEHWQTLIRARAIENQCYIVATNQCGMEKHGFGVDDVEYFGHSMLVDPWGEIIAEAEEKECLLTAEIELSEVAEVRTKLSAWDDRRADVFGQF